MGTNRAKDYPLTGTAGFVIYHRHQSVLCPVACCGSEQPTNMIIAQTRPQAEVIARF